MSSFCKCKSYSHFFSKHIYSLYAIFNIQSFNDTLTNDIVSSEQLGPESDLISGILLYFAFLVLLIAPDRWGIHIVVFIFLHESMLWVLIRSVMALPMSTHNICFY